MPNFMKIERGPDFFFVDLVWNDPYTSWLCSGFKSDSL